MTAALLSPVPVFKAFSNDGFPLAYGFLTTYAAGSNTKIPTYVDSTLTTQNTNPIQLNFRGECSLWLDPTKAYKFALTDFLGNPIPGYPVDNITSLGNTPFNAVDTGTVNNVVLTIPGLGNPTAISFITFKAANTNTGPVTLTVNGVAKSLTWQNLASFSGGEIQANGLYEAIYDGTQWQLQGPTLQPPQIRTAAEIAASAVVVNYSYQAGDTWRYGADPTGAADSTTAIQAAINQHIQGGPAVLLRPGTYKTTAMLNMGDQTHIYTGLQLIGDGLPTIQSTNNSVPILSLCGTLFDIFGVKFQYSALPDNTHTNAIAIRCYEFAFSRISHCWARNVYGMMDQYQGVVVGGQAAFFSNSIDNMLLQTFSGIGYNMIPFSGNNSGNKWSNIYINNTVDGVPSHSLTCTNAMVIQANDDTVINQINLETMKCSGPLLVLNQAGSIVINGLHMEGNYPTTAFSPLVDVLGGSGVSAPQIHGITLAGNDWTGYGGANQGSLIRIDANSTYMTVRGVVSRNNTTPANMQAAVNAGSTAFGSIIEFESVNDADGSLSSDSYTPKASFGAVTPKVEYPLQRWNLNIKKHSATVTDNAGGTATAVFTMTGTNPNGTDADPMGLWDSVNTVFVNKQTGNYLATVNIPTGVSPVVQVKVGASVIASFVLPAGGGTASATIGNVARGSNITFSLASGSYTRTGVIFGVSLAS